MKIRLLFFSLILTFCIPLQSILAVSIFAVSTDSSIQELIDTRDRYILDHLTDGSISPWCVSSQDFDSNSKLEIEFEEKEEISLISVAAGFYDSKLHKMNARPKKMILTFDDQSKQEISLKDIHTLQNFNLTKVKTQTISIQFPEITKGSKFQDFCVSEIAFKKISDQDIVQAKKNQDSQIQTKIKKSILFQSVQSDGEDSFKIQPAGSKYSIDVLRKGKDSIVLYQPYETYRLLLSPSPTINLIEIKTNYDKLSFSIDGKCSKESKDTNGNLTSSKFGCKIYFNPYSDSYQIYDGKKLIFYSRRPEMFQ